MKRATMRVVRIKRQGAYTECIHVILQQMIASLARKATQTMTHGMTTVRIQTLSLIHVRYRILAIIAVMKDATRIKILKIIVLTANPNEWDPKIHQKFMLTSDMHFELAIANIPGVGVSHQIYLHKFNGAQYGYQHMTAFFVKPKIGMCIETTQVAF